ncbi:MAG: copper oxidase [Methylovulum sp.]|uniref:copper oxidase n=1 Tax=Methylovulum sp. TaxID=1916980 RepID=UPI002630914C|nr:copper oxidase [Methylovulum sp.]MDD2723178.1 copper oxidase [Methylovulum sp.]MDD5124642.1 copper oxidase [Methylovulum sp.]
MVKFLSVGLLAVVFSAPVVAVDYMEHDGILMNHGDGHLMDMAGGMVMGQNADVLPGGCDSISETKEITVHAGHKYAEKFPGRMFAFDTQEFRFKPCTKLTVHFVNEDKIRHQWMMHGLPKYLYPKGMFHLEISGPAKISGTLILPPGDKTYLVHCDIAQHMEKGMKAQLKVGEGDGDLPSIPGVTANVVVDDYKVSLPELIATAEAEAKIAAQTPVVALAAAKSVTKTLPPQQEGFFTGMTVIGLALGLVAAPFLARKFKGMSASEIIATIFEWLALAIDRVTKLCSSLLKLILSGKNKMLPKS